MMANEEEVAVPREAGLAVALDRMSIGELEQRIVALRAEIARVELEIGRKAGHRSAADAMFRRD